MGEIHKAINCHQKSRQIANKFDVKSLESASFLNIGLCQIDIWEIQLAIESFEKCVQISENTSHRYYAIE